MKKYCIVSVVLLINSLLFAAVRSPLQHAIDSGSVEKVKEEFKKLITSIESSSEKKKVCRDLLVRAEDRAAECADVKTSNHFGFVARKTTLLLMGTVFTAAGCIGAFGTSMQWKKSIKDIEKNNPEKMFNSHEAAHAACAGGVFVSAFVLGFGTWLFAEGMDHRYPKMPKDADAIVEFLEDKIADLDKDRK